MRGERDLQPLDLHLHQRDQLSGEDESRLVVLTSCGGQIEAIGIRSLLESQGIACVVQGDQQSHFASWHPSITVEPRVMVRPEDVERARALLSSQPVHETTGDPLEGGLCPVHEIQAVAICGRCGTFLCASCPSLGAPPICDACEEAERLPARQPARSPKVFFAVLALGILLLLIVRSL